MSLTNAQYNSIMKDYEQTRDRNRHLTEQRRLEVYTKLPEYGRLDESVGELSVAQAKLLLNGDDEALTRLRLSLKDISRRKKELLVSAGYPVDYLEPVYTCPDCKDTGYIGTHKCHCFKKAIVDYLYTQSNLKDILDKENFSTCSLTYYSRNHIDPLTGRSSLESMETALNVCHNFVDTFSEEFHNILLYGDTGVGKTFLSHCIAKELMDSAYSVIYFTAAGLFDILAENTFGKRQDKDSDVFEHIYDCDLLIIDDLGTELPNSFTVSQLFICLNERILRQKSTIISTNLALEDIKSIYSERTFSRISSNYTILRITGDDIRIQKKLLNLGGTNDVTP